MKVAVLFIIFNRPENTKKVFDQIRKARPSKLYISADGPRKEIKDDAERCTQTRKVVEAIDWPCEVHTQFTRENLGCKMGPIKAINWFFENVEEGIILEDDCVPEESFFGFCKMMLDRYRDDRRVMMVSGTNYGIDIGNYPFSYFFSNYYSIWGWASWRRAWNYYDKDMGGWEKFRETKQLEWLFPDKRLADYYTNMFGLIRDGFDGWDVQWWFACIFQHGLAVVPTQNLINNIGLIGTHSETQGDYFINTRTTPIVYKHLIHPNYMAPDVCLNRKLYKNSHAAINLSSECDSASSIFEIRTVVSKSKQVLSESPIIRRFLKKAKQKYDEM